MGVACDCTHLLATVQAPYADICCDTTQELLHYQQQQHEAAQQLMSAELKAVNKMNILVSTDSAEIKERNIRLIADLAEMKVSRVPSPFVFCSTAHASFSTHLHGILPIFGSGSSAWINVYACTAAVAARNASNQLVFDQYTADEPCLVPCRQRG